MDRSRGFTLLEMVVAIGIFAIIAAISYGALNNFLDARAHINQKNEELRQLQSAFVLLEQDLRYAVNRSVRDEYGDREPAFVAPGGEGLANGERLRFTTVRPAPVGIDTHRITRVAWRLQDGRLSRTTWQVLDRDIDSREYQRLVMTGVEDMTLTFFEFDGEGDVNTYDEWAGATTLPAGIRVSVLLEDEPVYQRTFQLASGS